MEAAMKTELEITQKSNKESQGPRAKINALKFDIDTAMAQVTGWEQKEGQRATSVGEMAGEKKSKMLEDHGAAVNAAESLERLVDATKRASEDTQKEQVTADGQ